MVNLDYKSDGYQIITQFCTIFNHFKRHSNIHGDELDTLLYINNTKEDVTPIMLTHYFNVSKPRVTKIINALIEKNYIERKKSYKDGRSTILVLTQEGIQMIESMQDTCYEIIDNLVDELGFGDYIEMLELLKRANRII